MAGITAKLGCIGAAVMLLARARAPLRRMVAKASASSWAPPPPPRKVKIALCQIMCGSNKTSNIQAAVAAVKEAASNGAKLVVLPEMWHCPYSNDSFPTYAESLSNLDASPSLSALLHVAREACVTLVGGSIAERVDDKLYNTCCVIDETGTLLAKHRKLHLFDIDIPGKITFKESLTLTQGQAPTVVDTSVGRLGIGICYDLRFPELAQIYAQRGVQLIVYPGAFNCTTGPVHWELLQKARAVDNQLFVASCSPARNPESSYQAWGHSTVVGPFAEVLATTGHEADIVYAELDFAEVEERRDNMPLAVQRRYDLYGLLDKSV